MPTPNAIAESVSSQGVSRDRESPRLDSIDAFRGLAALGVALYHAWGHDGTYPWPSIGVVTQTPDAHWLSYLTFPLRWGYLGVSFFLVLSGFCIHLPAARKLAKSGSYQFKAAPFFLRRIWRLYPAYFVAVVATSILLFVLSLLPGVNLHEHSSPSGWDVITHLTLLHGYFESTFYSIGSIFWSLALEFQLYLAYPLFILSFRKFGTLKTVAAMTIISLVFRQFFLSSMGEGLISIAKFGPYAAMGSILARMPEWLFGVLLAELYVRREKFQKRKYVSRWYLMIAGAMLFSLAIVSTLDPRLWILTDPLFGLSFAAFVAAAVLPAPIIMTREKHPLPYRALVYLGVISYSFYLFHLQLSWLSAPVVDKLPGLILPFLVRILWLGVSILIIRLIFAMVEKPFLRAPRLGERFFTIFRKVQLLIGITPDPIAEKPAGEYAA